jgi:putative PIN family toxin of toxin-antitoxin system
LRCVFDTNVLVSALIFPDANSGKALKLARGQGSLFFSFQTAMELREVLNRTRFRKYFTVEDAAAFLGKLTEGVHWVEPEIRLSVCRDPKDDKFLELALSAEATHIVTGDFDLLVLHPYENVRIVSPRDFLEQREP